MPIKETIDQVKQFNKSFGVKANKQPGVLSEEEWTLKASLMTEELSEYIEACKSGDLVEIADAIVDMQYILSGIIIAHGLENQFSDLFKEVHESNMSKLENGKVLRREDGKVLKGKNYFPPDLKKMLKQWI